METFSKTVSVRENLSNFNSATVLNEFDNLDYVPTNRMVMEASQVRMLRSGLLARGMRVLPGSMHPQGRRLAMAPLRIIKSKLSENAETLPAGPLYAVCHSDWSSGFFHWITEVLPRMISVRTTFPEAVLVRPTYSSIAEVVAKTIEMLEFPSEVVAPMDRPLQIPEVCFRSVPWPMGGYHPRDLEEVRNLVLNKTKNPERTDRRLYISRKRAAYRHIANENDVVAAVTKRGFEVVYAEDLPFLEQVQLFSESEAVVSIHGAGLTNMLWMPKKSAVIEFIKERERSDSSKARASNLLNPSYPRMAALLDHRYAALICKPVQPNRPAKFADITVDIAALRDALDNLGV